LANQAPGELARNYFGVAEAIVGDAGTLVPDVIDLFLFLPSQAKALPHRDTPNINRIATNTFFIFDFLRHHNEHNSAIAGRTI
jgi:hypothetical protein